MECVTESEIAETDEKREGNNRDYTCRRNGHGGVEVGHGEEKMEHQTHEQAHGIGGALSPGEDDRKKRSGEPEQVERKSTNASKTESSVKEGEGTHTPKNAVECGVSEDDMEKEYHVVRAILDGLGELEEAYYRLQDAQEQVHYVRDKMVGGGRHSSRPSRDHAEKKENKTSLPKEEGGSNDDDHSSEIASSASSSTSVVMEDGGNEYSWWPTDEEMELYSSMSKRDQWRTTGKSTPSTAARIEKEEDNSGSAPEERNEGESEVGKDKEPHLDSGRKYESSDHTTSSPTVGDQVKGSSNTVQQVKALLQGRTGVECEEEAYFQGLAKEQLQLLLSSAAAETDTKGEETDAKEEGATQPKTLQQNTEGLEEKKPKYRTKSQIEEFWNTAEPEEEVEQMESGAPLSPLIADGMNADVDIAMCFNLALGGESCGISTSRVLGRHGLHA